ncbi:MAG: caspase family protein [Promethearchaeota archaeon]
MKRQKRLVLLSALFLSALILHSVSMVAAIAPPGGGGGTIKHRVYGYVKESGTSTPIPDATVKFYEEGVTYRGSTTTTSTGYFNKYIYLSSLPEFWEVRVTKSGYDPVSKVALSKGTTIDMGTVYMSQTTITYTIHGYLVNGFNSTPVEGATVTLYRDAYEYWTEIGTTITTQNGYYSHTYNTYYPMSQCRVVGSAAGYYDSANNIDVSGTDVDMGNLHLMTLLIKYAVIVGISDYKSISDLDLCDEDATDWYNYLTTVENYQSENVWVYGDVHSGNYPKYDGIATEYNVKAALENMIAKADQNDVVCFITAGHGGSVAGSGGDVWLYMWDSQSGENGEDGDLWDYEIADIFTDSVADKNFLFFDNCHSGGIGPELMALDNAEDILMCATCTWEGHGYDYPTGNNGKWTYWFLELGLIGQFGSDPLIAMEYVFQWAHDDYPHPPPEEDEPEMYDGDPSAIFRI